MTKSKIQLDIKDYIIVFVIIIIALAAGVLSAYQYIESNIKEKQGDIASKKLQDAQEKNIKASEEISSVQKKALDISTQLQISQKQTIEKANELVDAQNKINKLQNEIIKQVTGHGYPRLSVMDTEGSNFNFFIKGSSNYPLFKVYTKITDAEKLLMCESKLTNQKVEINKSCYDPSQLYFNGDAFDLNGTLMLKIDLSIPKKKYYLVTEFMCKNIRNVQYSIIEYDNNTLKHSYRIFHVSQVDNSVGEILEKSNPDFPDSEYEKHFFFKRTIILDFAK